MTDIAQIRRVLEGLKTTLDDTVILCMMNTDRRFKDIIRLINDISQRCRQDTMILLEELDAFDAVVQILKQVNKEVDNESKEGSEFPAQDDAGAEDETGRGS